MDVEASIPLDDKSKRMRDLLSSFYSRDPSSTPSSLPPNTPSRFATLDTINTTSFDSDRYMNLLVEKSNLEGLLQKHVEMAAEIKNLDTDLQMLVYENYNKFISATDAIKRMKNNITGMESNMEELLVKITSVQSRSDGVNTSLFEKRGHIEKLHRTRNLLRKIQFIYDLPARLEKCIKSEAYADAVKFYTGAVPIFKVYGDSSFEDCKRASEEAMKIVIKNLQGKVFSDSESIQSRAEAVLLLKLLDVPVENLKVKLFEKLEQFLVDLHLEPEELINTLRDISESPEDGSLSPFTSHEASIREFVEAVRAYRVIFSHSEPQLSKLARDLVSKHFEATYQQIKKQVCSKDLLAILRLIWTDVFMIDEVLPEASLPDFTIQSARVAVKDFISDKFTHLLLDISDALKTGQSTENEGLKEEYALAAAFEASKKALMQGSMNILQEFRQLVDDDSELVLNLREIAIKWVEEGFQNFFKKLDLDFHSLSGKSNEAADDPNVVEQTQAAKISAGLVLVLAHFSLYVEQSAIPRITEEITSFSGGGVRAFESGPSFVSADIYHIFRLSRETLLNLYIKMRTQKISVLLKKRFTAPNWVKHKEPREVHMFVDLLLHEFEEIRNEVKQILPQGPHHKHRRTDSNGSTTSSRSNPLRGEDRTNRSNTSAHKGRSQLLETHLAKLFKQKMEIFTKIEHTQESVLTTIVKLPLKSLLEFVRLQTFNRSGFQQIQLDIHFLKHALKDIAEEEGPVDFLLDEVIVASAERCLDPIPLEPAVLDRLVQAKLAKSTEQSPAAS